MTDIVVGWRERVGLPLLGVESIKAKIDTGAASSSIDVKDIEQFTGRDGLDWVRFTMRLSGQKTLETEAPVVGRRTIRNPGKGGREEQRYVIATDVAIGDQQWPIEVNLARRTRMRYRMLLGRQALAGRCLVDPDRSYLMGKGS